MLVARHWVRETVDAVDRRGASHRGEAWGWSATSVEEARARARKSAAQVAQWLADGQGAPEPQRSFQYMYLLDRPPREEIIQELPDAAGQTAALLPRPITRHAAFLNRTGPANGTRSLRP